MIFSSVSVKNLVGRTNAVFEGRKADKPPLALRRGVGGEAAYPDRFTSADIQRIVVPLTERHSC